jgi:hypothetical protein
MFDEVEVDSRIARRHPELSAADVLHAWRSSIVLVERISAMLPDAILVAVGFDAKGRQIEMVGAVKSTGAVHIFHAMTPPSKKTKRETGLDW